QQEPDLGKMNEAASILLNYQDFQCFSRSKTDVKTYHCDIRKAVWEKEGDRLIFTITADRFLRNMVRAIVGTLLDIGFDKISLEDLHKIIEQKDRSQAGASAPAHGLYLTKVVYPKSSMA
ncbi:MAG: tRNA pseudouridine(38-40) synthase TruA, partial [Bacteroidia bacterium]|nr:tRNA pseudouridine(38-40) synthase TruA [Bacteroidia bacterium]